MEKMSSSVQSWVQQHTLATVGALSATAVGASVACGRRHGRAKGLTVAAALGGAVLAQRYYSAKRREEDVRSRWGSTWESLDLSRRALEPHKQELGREFAPRYMLY